MALELNESDPKDVDEKESKKKKKKKKKEEEKVPLGRVFALNKPEWHYIAIGCVFSLLSGAVQPAFSIILAKAVGVSFSLNYIFTNYIFLPFFFIFRSFIYVLMKREKIQFHYIVFYLS